jgi:hypothetical protein
MPSTRLILMQGQDGHFRGLSELTASIGLYLGRGMFVEGCTDKGEVRRILQREISLIGEERVRNMYASELDRLLRRGSVFLPL